MLIRVVVLSLLLSCCAVQARDGKLLGTAGVTQFEGSGGGGLTPWALITSYATEDEWGAAAFTTVLDTGRYRLLAGGVGIGLFDRVELSIARQRLFVGTGVLDDTGAALIGALEPLLGNPGPFQAESSRIDMDVYGLKWRLFGDAIFAQDSFLPQVSIGLQHKRNRHFDRGARVPYLGEVGIPALLGAASASGTDVYLSATKAVLGVPAGRILVLNGTLRSSNANAFGLLGFGREVVNPLDGSLLDRDDRRRLRLEGSAALFLRPDLVVGGEFRRQGNRLDQQPVLGLLGAPRLAREETAWDLFLVWLPSKRASLTLAWVDLGNLPFQPRSRGAYASLQLSF